MPEYTVYFPSTVSIAIKVEAEDYDEAIDKAYEEMPQGICGQCSGWGNSTWSVDADFSSAEADEVTQDGKTVWSVRTS